MTFGVQDAAFEWFVSYLSDRCQSVIVDGIVSVPSPLVYGVPRGSVLGLVLFTLYSQSLTDVISAHGCDFHKYADDTEHSQSTPLDEFWSVQTGIQTCTDEVISWMNINKLSTDKPEVMTVGTSSRLSRVDCDSANIGSGNIPFKTSVKNLGVKFDQILSMQGQISNICRVPFLELRRLASIRPYLSKKKKKNLCKTSRRFDYLPP